MGIETIAIASLVGSAVSGVTGFIGAQQQAGAQAASLDYQAQVAKNNQIIATQNAQYATAAGGAQAQARDFKNRAVLGTIEAQQGASGIDFGSGTSEDIRRSARNIARLDTETLYNNALLQVRGAQAQASSFGSQATLDEFSARNARSAGLMKGFSSLLGGASSFADKWIRYQNVGVPNTGSIF